MNLESKLILILYKFPKKMEFADTEKSRFFDQNRNEPPYMEDSCDTVQLRRESVDKEISGDNDLKRSI